MSKKWTVPEPTQSQTNIDNTEDNIEVNAAPILQSLEILQMK